MNEKKRITEENDRAEIDSWFEQAGKQKFETLPEFIRHVMNDYEHDYGTVCHAIAACAVATAWACNEMEGACGGITGFQAGEVMWTFIRQWNYPRNKCGLRIIDYDHLLYPQYESYFEKTINHDTWEAIQREAKKQLKILLKKQRKGKNPYTSNAVVEHWRHIADGEVPFGFMVSDR